jgi:hypothetical protein
MFQSISRITIFYFLLTLFVAAHAQKNISNITDKKNQSPGSHDQLFVSDDILHFKLIGRLNNLFNDRNKNISYHPLLLQYKLKDSSVASIKVMVKTRGNFRRLAENCKMPPLMLNFSKTDKMKGSPFENQKKLKLVVPCQGGDEYVIREWLVYKLYNLITEKSFRARLVKVEFEDSSNKRNPETHYCILLEDEKKMADRNKSFMLNRKMIPMKSVEKTEFTKMAVFQYMIGNTDWSVPYLQNIKLITRDSAKAPFAIPYDFDHAGIVDAPYARPAEELEISSTRERIYRGYCENDKKIFTETFELFNKLKDDFYKLYTACSLLSGKYVKSTTKFLNDFYKEINDDKAIDTEFGKPCRTNMRIEIKGLKE